MSWPLSPCNFRGLFCKMHDVVYICYWQICRENSKTSLEHPYFDFFLSESRLFKLLFTFMKQPSTCPTTHPSPFLPQLVSWFQLLATEDSY